ncbi:ribonuclease H-like domain-containing protein [Rhizophagus clarus]|uniref:Ribonuclease H-like domain-containing protein n=1 Tax=Rhizophagus clarus TaxID=94130 RepID=A0A8H3QEW2_9GLOM|nr:ribonuclease H-like domain-containing protein [Rhizophagus clarus]
MAKRPIVDKKIWLHKIGDSNTTNLWHHLEKYHPDKDPKLKKAKILIAEGQSTLDGFVGQTEISPKNIPENISFALDAWISIGLPKISCQEFGILEKIFAITSDNASNNDTFIKYLENVSGEAQTEDFILNNIDEAIPAGEIIPKISLLRKLIVKIQLSPQRKKKFARQAEAAGLKKINLILDIFIQATKVVSSAKYPILTTTIPIYNLLIDELESYCDKSSNSDIIIAVKAGLKKLYIYLVATVLDPWLKLNYYEDNKWKQSFIRYAKETAHNIYNTNYAPIADEHSEDIDNDENDEFLDHLFGKQKKSKENEVELYLKTS